MSVAGVMGEQQITCTTANKWYVVEAPSTASGVLIEAEADGRFTLDSGVADGDDIASWGGTGVRGLTLTASAPVSGDVPSSRRIAVSSATSGTRVAFTFTDRVR